MSKLDTIKVNLIREHITNGLNKSETYSIVCKLSNPELQELGKYFNINHIDSYGEYIKYQFEKKTK